MTNNIVFVSLHCAHSLAVVKQRLFAYVNSRKPAKKKLSSYFSYDVGSHVKNQPLLSKVKKQPKMSGRTFLPGALQFLVLCTMFLPAVFENCSLAGLNVHPGHSKTSSLYSREKSSLTFVFFILILFSQIMEAQIFQMRMVNLKMVLLMARKEVPQGCFFCSCTCKTRLNVVRAHCRNVNN